MKYFIISNKEQFIFGSHSNDCVIIYQSELTPQVRELLLNHLLIKKIYTLGSSQKRLMKKAYMDDVQFIDTGSMTNFSNFMYNAPLGLHFPDFQNNYINRKDRTYGPNIDRTWKFIELNDHPEWLMYDTR